MREPHPDDLGLLRLSASRWSSVRSRRMRHDESSVIMGGVENVETRLTSPVLPRVFEGSGQRLSLGCGPRLDRSIRADHERAGGHILAVVIERCWAQVRDRWGAGRGSPERTSVGRNGLAAGDVTPEGMAANG